MLSDYYDSSDAVRLYRYKSTDFPICNNGSSNLELLNDEAGLYGRTARIISPHADRQYNYTLYFQLYFVIPVENVCRKNGSIPAYYLSLVALNANGRTQDPNKGQVVWTANAERPVTKNACLQLREVDSNLMLIDYSDNNSAQVVWGTNTTSNQTINGSVAITFEGNLVLFSNTTDPPFVPLWQSHQQPTDTLMVLQVLQEQSILRSHSPANSSAPAVSGRYTLTIQNGTLSLYARIGKQAHDEESPGYGSRYWVWPDSSSSPHNISFAALCWDSVNELRLYAGSNRPDTSLEISPASCSSLPAGLGNDMNVSYTQDPDQPTNVTFATFLRLDVDGDLRAYTVNDTSYPNSIAVWTPFYSVLDRNPCQLPLYCGFYGICNPWNDRNYCECDNQNFEYAVADKPNYGCNIISSTEGALPTDGFLCSDTDKRHIKTDFLAIQNVYYFSLHFTEPEKDTITASSCKDKCREDCNCTAVFWNGDETSCFLIRGQVGTIQRSTQPAMVAYIRYRAYRSRNSLKVWLSVAISTTFALFMACVFLLCCFCKRRNARKLSEFEKERVLLLSLLGGSITDRFTWKQMHEYTCGFSDFLGGGAFGRVFRGSLPDGTPIAVKQLEEDGSHQGHGNKEFVAEVSILSKIHHAHLVRLIGFCLEGTHRILVYEYMEHGSLDAWLFKTPFLLQEEETQSDQLHPHMKKKGEQQRKVLHWQTRFQIALGTAKGLAYLHEECEERVIHMDFKPQNILLGRNFVAKISDFGMSRRTNREQSSVMTVMRGTPGYLAPEWLLDCAITEKCDVYSFGIVLLEMVSGRKVRDLKALKQRLGMRPLRDGVMLDLLDEDLTHNDTVVKEKEAVRMVEIALLCVRTDPEKRPEMSSVVRMLEGKEEVVVDDDDADHDHELVRYPSGKNKTMRSMPEPRRSSDSLTSLYDSGGGSNIWSSSSYKQYLAIEKDKNRTEKKKQKEASFYRERDHESTEYDHLLQI